MRSLDVTQEADELCSKLAENFQRRRLDADLSQKALAELSGVSISAIRRFEQTGEISLCRMAAIAVVLNCAGELESALKPEPQSIFRKRASFSRKHE
ncbi:MAG: helix-turn-helix domain-containing protein [Sutterella sp.]